jgi:Tol biopolymer transport system component
MLAGRRPFAGDDVSTTLAAVLLKDPDWEALPASMPVALRRLLKRCLTKDSKTRLRDIGEARVRIDELLSGPADEMLPPALTAPPPLWKRVAPRVAAGALLVAAVLAAGAVARRPAGETASAPAVRFAVPPPENTSFGGPVAGGTGIAPQLAVSPDGQHVVFVARTQSTFRLWLRPIATLAARPMEGTEGGTFPFWSPDSRHIAFFADGKLKRVPIAGGPTQVLCDAPSGRGGSWSRDNVIVFSPLGIGTVATGLMRVSSNGGTPSGATTIDSAAGETHHRWPHFLPDGRHFLYTASTGACCPPPKPAVIKIGSLDPGEATATVFEAESATAFASGHLVFARDERLMAQPFDSRTRQPTGEPFPLADHVASEGSRYVSASLSEHGTLGYAAGGGAQAGTQLTWFDRTGRALGTVGEPAPFVNVALSPDERRIAVALSAGLGNLDVWVIDIARNVRSRLTFDPGADGSPVWSPDGTLIAFESKRPPQVSIRQLLANGAGGDAPLFEGSTAAGGIAIDAAPNDWSADGRYIAYTQRLSTTTSDLWVLPLFGNRKAIPVVQSNVLESSGAFSPDGRWIAYAGTESGQPNVFVQAFPGPGAKHQVSRDGGGYPTWRGDGKELFYLALDSTLTAVRIEVTDQLTIGAPQRLFQTSVPRLNAGRVYAVTKDGQRFLLNARSQHAISEPLTVVVNWTAAIQK